MVLEEYAATIKASRLSDEDEEGEPLELDEPEDGLYDDDDTGQLVEDEEEEDLPPTVHISGDDEEEKDDKKEKDDFGQGTEEDDSFKDA